jgi:TatD DNase family protein
MSDNDLQFVDSHCHLNLLDLDAWDGSFERMMAATRDAGVSHVLCIATELETFHQVRDLAEQWPWVHATVGVHPLYGDAREPSQAELVELAAHPRVVAIGETGLDYYYAAEDADWQRERFRVHIRAARETGLPLVIHTRKAREDTLRLIEEEGEGEVTGVLHCYTENRTMAERALELGFYISVSGIATFQNASKVRKVIDKLPLDRLLIETDAPWLAPEPYRGKPNEPRYVPRVAETVAELQGVSVAEVARVTRDNYFRLFSKAEPAEEPAASA